MKRFLFITMMGSLIFNLSVIVAQETVAFDSANPPYMYDKGGSPAGLYPELFREAFNRMGEAATFVALPWKRALDDCDTGKSGVGGIYQNADRLSKYDYSAPYYEEHIAVYTLKSSGFIYTSIKDLYGKTVGVLQGWSYGDDFDNAVTAGKIKKEEVTGDSVNITKLSNKRVDAILSIVESGDAEVGKQNLSGIIFRQQKYLSTSSVYLVFNKSVNKKAVLLKFDNAIASMKKDGSFDRIVKSVFGK
jgi:ABC-type amino acid transport/signal transduction systems, periplasmic component/domain